MADFDGPMLVLRQRTQQLMQNIFRRHKHAEKTFKVRAWPRRP